MWKAIVAGLGVAIGLAVVSVWIANERFDDKLLLDAVWTANGVAPAFDLLQESGHGHQSGLPKEGPVPLGNLVQSQPLKIDKNRCVRIHFRIVAQAGFLIADIDQIGERFDTRRFDKVAGQPQNATVHVAFFFQFS